MAYHRFLRPRWWVGLVLVVGMCLAAAAQQAAKNLTLTSRARAPSP